MHRIPCKCKPGENVISLAERVGQTRGWSTIEVRSASGETVTKRRKTFHATWRPSGGVNRVVIVNEEDGLWKALLDTDPAAALTAIVKAALERWTIEQSFETL